MYVQIMQYDIIYVQMLQYSILVYTSECDLRPHNSADLKKKKKTEGEDVCRTSAGGKECTSSG